MLSTLMVTNREASLEKIIFIIVKNYFYECKLIRFCINLQIVSSPSQLFSPFICDKFG